MPDPLTDEDYQKQVGNVSGSAFRLEQQPSYHVGYERALFDSFLTGSPEPPTNDPRFRAWYDRIRQQNAIGIVTERVRLVDEPPTDYQRWTRFMDRWNLEAGEVIHYLRRESAARVGLTDAFPGCDWWLLDDTRLILMRFDGQGRRIAAELATEENELRQARSWRDVAILAARRDAT